MSSSYQVFARKYRPQTFDDVLGQEHITHTLKNAIEQDRLAHAYLFVGPRGTGKTSTARILAKALNCVNGPTTTPCGVCDVCREIAQGNSLDVLEIDGASNNGVEQVRELRDNVRFAPTRGKYKVYIIDEVHMLTSAAFNALLKTLEEPPAHVKFIFATTEPQKVLPTILSRCQRFDLRRIPTPIISKHLLYIAEQEKVNLAPEAAHAIAKGAEGGLRDAESMLDQLVAFCADEIAEEDVLSIFGFTAQQTVAELCEHVLNRDSPQALGLVHAQAESGKDLSRLMAELIGHLRDLLVAKADPKGMEGEAPTELLELLRAQAERMDMERLLDLIELFAAAGARMKWAPNKRLHFEVAVIRAIQTLNQTTLTEVIDTLAAMRSGKEIPDPATPAPRTTNFAALKRALEKPSAKPVAKKEAPAASPEPPAPAAPPAARTPQPAAVALAAPTPEPEPEPPREEPKAHPPTVAETPEPSLEQDSPKATPEPTAQDDLPELWISLLNEIRQKRPLISAWVEAGMLLELENDVAVIGFPPEQKLAVDSLARPNNKKFVEELLVKFTGRPTTMRCIAKPGLIVVPPPRPEPEAPETTAETASSLQDDPLIRKALEIFKGEIQNA